MKQHNVFLFLIIILSIFLFSFSVNNFNSLLKEKKYSEAEELLLSSNLPENKRLEYYLKLGIEFYNINNFNKAKTYFIKIIMQKPDDYLAHTYLGIIYFLEKNYSKALIELQTAIKLNKQNQIAYTYLGKLHFQLNDYVNAEKYFLAGLSIDEENIQHLIEMMKFYYAIENFGNYTSFGKKIINSKKIEDKEKINIISDLFNYYLKTSNYEEAIELYKSNKKIFQNNSKILKIVAELYYRMKDYKTAKDLILSYYKKNQSDKSILKLLIMICIDENKFAEAIKYFDEYILTEKIDIDLLLKITNIYRQTNELEKYKYFFKLLITKFDIKNIPEAYILENMNFLYKSQNYEFLNYCFSVLDNYFIQNNEYVILKINYYKKILNLIELDNFFDELKKQNRLNDNTIKTQYQQYLITTGKFEKLNEANYSNEEEILYLKGYYEYINNNLDSALSYWLKYIEKNKKNEEINYFISEIYRQKNNFAEQIKYLEKVVEINPYNYQALEKLVELNIKFSNIKQAEYYLFQILQIDKNSKYARSKLLSLGLFDDDTKIMNALNYTISKSGVKLKKEYFEKVKEVVINNIKEKKYEEGLTNIEKLKYIETNFLPNYYFYLGICNLHTQNYFKAYIYFSLSLQLQENISALYNLAKLNYNFQNYEKALEQIQRLRILSNNKEWIDLDLFEARVLFELQNFDKLNLLLMNLKKYNLPVVEQYLYLLNDIQGDKNYEDEKYKYAITFYENNLKSEINKDMTYFKIGNCYYKLNDYENARINYEKALYYTDKNYDILNNLYLTYYNLQDYRKAEEYLGKIKEQRINEKELENPIYKIKNLLNQQKYEEAEKMVNQIRDEQQNLILKIFINYIKNQEIKLLNYVPKKYANIQPLEINYFVNYLYYLKEKKYKEAFEALKSAYSASCYSPFYLKEIALFFKNTKNYKKGIEYLKNQLETKPLRNKTYLEFLIGNLYFYNEQYQTAIDYYKLVLKNKSDYIPALKNLIISLIKTDNEDEAMYYLNNFEGDKKFKHLMNYFIYEKKGLYNLAEQEYEASR